MMTKFADEIRQMDIEIDRKQREQEALDRRSQNLAKDLEAYREKDAKYAQIRMTLEDESQRRVLAEADCDRLRNALSELQAKTSAEIDNNKRVIDELKYTGQESMNTIHQRNMELAELGRLTLELKQLVAQRDVENEDLREQIVAVESKNKMLNDKINEIIYNKATSYKEKTIEALKKGNDHVSPTGRKERAQQFGIQDLSEIRLN